MRTLVNIEQRLIGRRVLLSEKADDGMAADGLTLELV